MILNPLAFLGPLLGRIAPSLAGGSGALTNIVGGVGANVAEGGLSSLLGRFLGGAKPAPMPKGDALASMLEDLALSGVGQGGVVSESPTGYLEALAQQGVGLGGTIPGGPPGFYPPLPGGSGGGGSNRPGPNYYPPTNPPNPGPPNPNPTGGNSGIGDDLSRMLAEGALLGTVAAGASNIGEGLYAGAMLPGQLAYRNFPEGHFKNAVGHGMDAAGGLGSAAWSGLTMDPAGWVEGIGRFAQGTIDAAKELKNFAAEVAEGNRRFKDYSGAVAAADAELEIGRLRREIELGQDTGGSAAASIRSQDRLEESMQELNESLATLKNVGATAANDLARLYVEVNKLDPRLRIFEFFLEQLEKRFTAENMGNIVNVLDYLKRDGERRMADERRRGRGGGA